MTQVASLDDRVSETVSDILEPESLEEAFVGFLTYSEENEKLKYDCRVACLTEFFSSISQESVDTAVRIWVSHVHQQRNWKRSQLLLDMLDVLVAQNIVPAKTICDALLQSDSLEVEKEFTWCQTFKLVRKIVGGVDYKGCRDLLRFILEKCQDIQTDTSERTRSQAKALYDILAYIIDRNACLLPSYFAVNEISKVMSDDKTWPHWDLGRMLAEFIQSFRPTAQMVTLSGRSKLLPIVGHSSSLGNVWKLNPSTLRFPLSGPLPYDKELYEPQTSVLRHVMEQPYSREMVCNILCLNKQAKQRCIVLEEQLINLVILAMERSEKSDPQTDDGTVSHLLWQHLSSQLIFFVLFQFASFPHMVNTLYDKLKGRNLTKGRDHLMWVLLQFISGSIQKNPLSDFLPVLKLYDLLYPETSPLAVPDVSHPSCTHSMAVTCVWIHLMKKAQNNRANPQRPVPQALKNHMDYLKKEHLNTRNLPTSDYRIALLCNAYSTNTDLFTLPMSLLVESFRGNQQNTTTLPGNISSASPTQPLALSFLDSLTVHAKMSLIHSIVTGVIRLAQTKSNIALAPALVETYSRLLVYMEIESLGIKGFISQLLPTVVRSFAWGILHTMLEMFSYRLHHIQPHYRIQLLTHLHTLSHIPQTNQNQLILCVESTALRLITGLGSSEVQPQLSRLLTESKNSPLLNGDSEELNRALVLTLARAMHVTGSQTLSSYWYKDLLSAIMQHTPHGWSSHTLACFPPVLSEFFHQNAISREDRSQLKKNVDLEYRKWKSMQNEDDLVAHFSMQGTPPLFLCILFRCLLEDNRMTKAAYKVLERLGPRTLSSHLRVFADYLVIEFSMSQQGQFLSRFDLIKDMIWRYNIVQLDRLVLCLALRNLEGNEAHVCFFVIHHILVKPPDFIARVNDFESENSPEHWLQANWHTKHMAYHMKYPEKYYFEGIQDSSSNQHTYLPIYFGNVCLRFLPVFDIVIHRFLELPAVSKLLETLLDTFGKLYRFHDRPVTYLYNTLHYYERKLQEKPNIKRKLVAAIIGAQTKSRPPNWCLTESYQNYLTRPVDDIINWMPDQDYYITLVGRLVDTMSGNSPFPNFDWRFNEFPNATAHALHVTCIELMSLPVASSSIGRALLDIVLKSSCSIPRDSITAWMNAIGLILTSLPESFWAVLNDEILSTVQSPVLCEPKQHFNPFQAFNFTASHEVYSEIYCSYIVALCHAVWYHASIGQLNGIPQFMKEKVKPVVRKEEQMIFLCHLVGPFLQRFHSERTRCLMELTIELYEMLSNIDKSSSSLQYMDPICDFLYHIKYMFVGDGVKNEVEKIIAQLRPALRLRLRYIAYQGREETKTPSTTE